MNKSALVFRVQLARFKCEKGMMFFYCLSIGVMGVIVPIFMRGVASSLTMAALLTAAFLKPILADSLAGEREHRTLETLLASPMNGKSVMAGKFHFSLLFAICFFGLTTLCAALTSWFIGYEITFTTWQWFGIIAVALLNFSAISIAGVYISATSGDLRVANSRVSYIAYPLGFAFLVYVAAVTMVDFIPALIISAIIMLIYLCIIIFFAIKVIKAKQSDYFEHVKVKKFRTIHENDASNSTPKSQFQIVFRFELKKLMTLKFLLLNFGAMCVAPALVACLLPSYTGKFDLNYAVFIAVLLIPRVPTNLINYSIGGEKAYKTGESLLATPLHIRSVFLAKCMVPILISTVMLIVSLLFTWMGVTIYDWVSPDIVTMHTYSVEQLVLIFPVGIMSSMLMMFLSAILTLIMKTPRQGLYVTSVISFLFVAPVFAIIYVANNILMGSVIYFVVLLICNVLCIWKISDKIARPQIMNKL